MVKFPLRQVRVVKFLLRQVSIVNSKQAKEW